MKEKDLHLLQKLKQVNETWELSIRKAPTWIRENKKTAPYRPHCMAIVDEQYLIVGSDLFHPPVDSDQAWTQLLNWMRKPALGSGNARRPIRILTDRQDLVDTWKASLAEISIAIEYRTSLPHLDIFWKEFSNHIIEHDNMEPIGMLSVPSVPLPLVRHLYEQSAQLYRLAPWERLEGEFPIEIQYPPDNAARYAVVIGVKGEQKGISFYDSAEDVTKALSVISPEELLKTSSWMALLFNEEYYIDFPNLIAIEEHGWPVAAPDAYPLIIRVGSSKKMKLPTKEDLEWVDAVLPALLQFLEKDLKINQSGTPRRATRTYTVKTDEGEHQVIVRVPAQIDWEANSTLVSPKTAREMEKIYEKFQKADFKGIITTSQKLLEYLPEQSPLRIEVLGFLGNAYAMLGKVDDAYQAFSAGLNLSPDDPDLLYNRGTASLYVFRTAQSVMDLEKAVRLEKDPTMKRKFKDSLDFSRKLVKQELRLRGPKFTIEQLAE